MASYTVDFEPIGRRVKCSSEETILDCAHRFGVGINSVCGAQGTCHSCKVQVLGGTVTEPTANELEAFSREVTARRRAPDFIINAYRQWPRKASPMDALQASVPMLALADPAPVAQDRDEMADKALGLIAVFPTLVAAWHRIQNGLEPRISRFLMSRSNSGDHSV